MTVRRERKRRTNDVGDKGCAPQFEDFTRCRVNHTPPLREEVCRYKYKMRSWVIGSRDVPPVGYLVTWLNGIWNCRPFTRFRAAPLRTPVPASWNLLYPALCEPPFRANESRDWDRSIDRSAERELSKVSLSNKLSSPLVDLERSLRRLLFRIRIRRERLIRARGFKERENVGEGPRCATIIRSTLLFLCRKRYKIDFLEYEKRNAQET